MSVYVIAGGVGLGTTNFNTISNKVSIDLIINEVEDEDIRKKLTDSKYSNQSDEGNINDKVSVWGFNPNRSSHDLKEDDLVFITYKNAAVYMGCVLASFDTKGLTEIWGGISNLNRKVVFKKVFQIFIPDENATLSKNDEDPEKSRKETFKLIEKNNPFFQSVTNSINIKERFEKGDGLRKIISMDNKYGPFQKCTKVEKSKKDVLDELGKYLIRTHYRCLVRVIK